MVKGSGPAEPATLDRAALRRDLETVRGANNRYFVLCVAMSILLFIISIVVVLTNLTNTGVVKVVMSAFGIPATGLITFMSKLWRVKSNTEMLILLAINTDADTIKAVINILSKQL